MKFQDLNESQRRAVIFLSDTLIDRNPLWLLRLRDVSTATVNANYHELLEAFATTPSVIFLSQVYETLKDHPKFGTMIQGGAV